MNNTGETLLLTITEETVSPPSLKLLQTGRGEIMELMHFKLILTINI